MCNCIKELEEKILNHVTENKLYKKPVKKVKMKGQIFSLGDSLTIKTTSDFEIKLEGQKKKPSMSVAHAFCAFCGERKEEVEPQQAKASA